MLQKHRVPFTLGWTDLVEAQREALMLENGQPFFFLQISGVTWHYYIKKNKKNPGSNLLPAATARQITKKRSVMLWAAKRSY